MSSPVVLNAASMGRTRSRFRVHIQLLDCDGGAVDPETLELEVQNGGCAVYCEDYFQEFIYPKVHRIVKVPGKAGAFYIDWGDACFPAVVNGVGGVFPTGFLGGETLTFMVDNKTFPVTFANTDQSVEDVAAVLNLIVGVGIGQPFAKVVAGQLQLTSPNKGAGASILISGQPAVLNTLGLPAGYTNGSDITGESSWTSKLLFIWKFSTGSETSEKIQVVYVLPAVFIAMLPRLRLLIDKSLKLVDNKEGCFLGYTDAQLIEYLLGGMEKINSYQPSIFFNPDNYPYSMFGETLIEAALIVGVMSQTLFAIDTDVTSYNDQGQSFVINHQQPLAAFLNTLVNNLDRNIPLFKLHFVRSGTVLTQTGASYRMNALMSAAPSGATFRGIFFKA